MNPPRPRVTTQELDELAGLLSARFITRTDLFARQLDDGRYVSIRAPLKPRYVTAHLRGYITLGAYLLDADSRGRLVVFDADDPPDWRRLEGMAAALAEQGAAAFLERSRRGGHLWLFFEGSRPGTELRRFGQGLQAHFDLEHIELFPKQGVLGGGPGSTIRLPFGVHRKTGRRYGFYHPDGSALAPTLREQIRLLANAPAVPEAVVERYIPLAPAEQPRRWRVRPLQPVDPGDTSAPLSDRIRAALPVRDFVSRYVRLTHSGSGLCPFHDDHVPSFHVNDRDNYWYCFACEMGGSIIHFWMYYRDIDYATALHELARELKIDN